MRFAGAGLLVLMVLILTCMPVLGGSATGAQVVNGDQVNDRLFTSALPASGIFVVSLEDGRVNWSKMVSDDPTAVSAGDIKSVVSTSVSAKTNEEKVAHGPYTSLIVDATGLGVQRAMSPKIRRLDGSEVWGTVKVNADYAIENGIVGYATDMDGALKCSRCGSNPLIVKALPQTSQTASKCDVIISDEDAKRMLEEDKSEKFLKEYRVILILGQVTR